VAAAAAEAAGSARVEAERQARMADGTSSEAEVTAFLDELRDTALIHNFIENLGQDLVSTGVLREAEFGKKPGMLQLAKLTIRFKQSGIQRGRTLERGTCRSKPAGAITT
jgi:hypothetical protein